MIPVTVPCSCPGKPHESDTVSLPDEPDIAIGAAMLAAMRHGPSGVAEMEAAIAAAMIHVAPREWTFIDDKGDPLPVTMDNIDARLTWNRGGMEVVEKASDLYGEGNPTGAFAPLLRARSKASRSTRTGSSTSRTRSSGRSTRSSAKPSLRTVTGGQPSEAQAS